MPSAAVRPADPFAPDLIVALGFLAADDLSCERHHQVFPVIGQFALDGKGALQLAVTSLRESACSVPRWDVNTTRTGRVWPIRQERRDAWRMT